MILGDVENANAYQRKIHTNTYQYIPKEKYVPSKKILPRG
jgi:hypothetical protein